MSEVMSKEKTEQDYVNELWQFPCEFLFKAMAFANVNAEDKIVSVIQEFVPGDYVPKLTPSSKGTYVSVSVSFTATSKEQLNQIYVAVNALDCVKVCL
jgi:uncharacterized protein